MARPMRWLLLILLLLGATPAGATPDELRQRLESMATAGSPAAAYHLGMIHHLGLEGTTRDARRAFAYFNQAAAAGDALGAYKVGCFYAGQGDDAVEPDRALALRYKLVAAEAGYALAQIDVGNIYRAEGNREQALHWLEAAARQGEMQAIFALMISSTSEGNWPDSARALFYFELFRRKLAEMTHDLQGAERALIDERIAEQGRQLDAQASDADRAAVRARLSEWREERSPVSRTADLGLEAARQLVSNPS